MEISLKQARRLALEAQGLTKSKPFGAGKNGLLRCVEQLGYVQIDTISVIRRAHHHTIWTRVPSYKECHLDELQRAGKILEYWAHAAAYVPMEDYRYCRTRMEAIAGGEKHWHIPDKKMMKFVLDRIKAEGPLMARDFEPPPGKKTGEWWGWKPAKRALEQLFIEGKLMSRERINFHKVYDLPERVLPPQIETTAATPQEYCTYLIKRAIKAHGLIADSEISYLRKGIKQAIRKRLQEMLFDNQVVEIRVEGSDAHYYSSSSNLDRLNKGRVAKEVHLLSPFDNAIIQRKRVQQIFDFDYQLECYVPKAKRVHGYFCLPILYGDEFVGRLDPKADRKAASFLIRNLYLENMPKDTHAFYQKLAKKLKALAEFNDCPTVVVEKSEPLESRKVLTELLRKLDSD